LMLPAPIVPTPMGTQLRYVASVAPPGFQIYALTIGEDDTPLLVVDGDIRIHMYRCHFVSEAASGTLGARVCNGSTPDKVSVVTRVNPLSVYGTIPLTSCISCALVIEVYPVGSKGAITSIVEGVDI
jgi:hypothetical protein